MRSLVVAMVVGLLVASLAHTLGMLLTVLGLILIVTGILLTLTAIGAVIGMPLGLLGALVTVLGAFGAEGKIPTIVLGTLAALVVYTRLERRQTRALH